MSIIAYIDKRFSASTLSVISNANLIIDEYQADGLDLTLRQLYYQFVSRDLIANTQKEYKRLGTIISDARLAGMISWAAIEDRTRNLKSNSQWENPGDIIKAAVRSFRIDHWKGQDFRPEVWIEKEALVGVIADICEELDVSYFACKGYVSQSEMWKASQRFIEYGEKYDQVPIIIHLGDHDPSGIDMTRDISDRQELFTGIGIQVDRIALNFNQVEHYNPPPNPAKLSDSRAATYVQEYGYSSWELDALEPRLLQSLISEAVLQYRDNSVYDDVIHQETKYLELLARVERNWRSL